MTVVAEVPSPVIPEVLATPDGTKPPAPAGTIEVCSGRVVVKVNRVVDAKMLRAMLGSLSS